MTLTMSNRPLTWVASLAIGITAILSCGVAAAPLGFSGIGPKSAIGRHQSRVDYRRYYVDPDGDDDAALFAPEDAPPPPSRYGHPPAAALYPPAYEWLPPPRPVDCGEYHYWNGEYCVDARSVPPYVGPRW